MYACDMSAGENSRECENVCDCEWVSVLQLLKQRGVERACMCVGVCVLFQILFTVILVVSRLLVTRLVLLGARQPDHTKEVAPTQ